MPRLGGSPLSTREKSFRPAAGGDGRFGGRAVTDEFTDLQWIAFEGPQHCPF
jgi:hypothetical protein